MTDVLALRPSAAEPLPFAADTETLFADHKGEYRKSIEKRQRKLAAKLTFLGPFLRPGERVRLITTACSPFTVLEQLTTGYAILYLKRTMLVVTDERILQVLTNRNFVYRDSIAEIRFEDCASMKQSFSALKIEYRNGTKERFLYVAGAERRRLKDFLKAKTFAPTGGGSAARTHLCPRCMKPLQHDVYECGACRLEFKSLEEGRRRALLFPGGGYFYTGHWFIGIADALMELILIVLLIVSILGLSEGGEGMVEVSILFGVLLIIEKAISLYHTNHFIREYIPKEKVTLK
jgi:hypothetical protein